MFSLKFIYRRIVSVEKFSQDKTLIVGALISTVHLREISLSSKAGKLPDRETRKKLVESVQFANMSRPKVLVANPTVPQIGIDLLKERCDVVITSSNKEAILKDVAGVDAIFWATDVRLENEILEKAGPQLKVVSTMSAGYNHIDTNELKKRGIKLGNTPEVLSNSVADVAIFLALGAARRATEGRHHIERNTWLPSTDSQWMLGLDFSESNIGIIGLGGIGQAIAKRARGFDVQKILYTGHREKPEGKQLGAEFVNLDTLLKESDFIFVAAPLTTETENMCNAEFFSKMKKTGVFINISRGKLVDQPALVKALKEKQIFAAGLDVMVPEPLPSDHELVKLENVVLLPHLGSATVSTRNRMSELAAQNLLMGLAGKEMFTPVQL